MDPKETFQKATGADFFLHREAPDEVKEYLKKSGWLKSKEKIKEISKPGEGNMNHVVRVTTDKRSFILKQSRPWVEKFPQIEAPVDRVLVEAQFYELVGENNYLLGFTPELLARDDDNYLLMLEDLGQGADLTYLYKKGELINPKHLRALMGFISRLHGLRISDEDREGFPDNLAMRRLNHEHLFVYPLMEDNGFDLNQIQPGLQEVAAIYKRDEELKSQMTKLGERYLDSGPCLLHGDYFPGSWLKVDGEIKVIDPEFCFFGPPEYDLGVAIAHLMMARAPAGTVEAAQDMYSGPSEFNFGLRKAFTGMEIIRRLIGLAQLPLDLSLEERTGLLEKAKRMLLRFTDWEPVTEE